MLTITRKPDQSVNIHLPDGRDIILHVGRWNGSQIKLSWDAPEDVVILRSELERRDVA